MLTNCINEKNITLFISAFFSDAETEGHSGGGGGNGGGAGSAPGGQDGSSPSGEDGSGGSNTDGCPPPLNENVEQSSDNPFVHIKGDFNYITRDWNYCDALFLSDLGVKDLLGIISSDPATFSDQLLEFISTIGNGVLGVAVPLYGQMQIGFYICAGGSFLMDLYMNEQYLKSGNGAGIYAINVSSLVHTQELLYSWLQIIRF
ncbi:hypothetical protein SDC9_135554 [bioreactor metagenome]|uniref:Uncharacterized protein n=1 Tax=bioreactor metagenome TaxID=1076179 RepID=A0A645DG45_9ZZZZ